MVKDVVVLTNRNLSASCTQSSNISGVGLLWICTIAVQMMYWYGKDITGIQVLEPESRDVEFYCIICIQA